MPYNADLATATSYAPQIGTLGATGSITSTQGTVIWNNAYDKIRICLREVGVGDTFTGGSIGEGWAQRVEGMLTSGEILMAKGSLGKRGEGSRSGGSGDTTAERLIRYAMDELNRLKEDRQLREVLISAGGSRENLPQSPFGSSDWTDGKDPDFNETFGPGGDLQFIPPPTLQDGDDL
jgi:hypothetical protein